MNTEHDDTLMQDAAKLATEIAPENDLWPGVEAAITAAPKKSWTPYFAQAAAVVLLVAASSIITFVLTSDQANVSPGAIASTASAGHLETDFVVGDQSVDLGQGFQIARGNLQTQLDRELDRLSPDARVNVEQNLRVIRDAITEINTAIEQEPDNSLLQELLLKTYREELAVMRKVGGLTQSVMSRNDI